MTADLFYADQNWNDIGIFSDSSYLDCDINSGEYDFELTVHDDIDGLLTVGNRIYVPNTEYGGIIQKLLPSDTDGVSVYGGKTWRGLLLKEVIEPPSGSDYKVVSGDINTVLASLFSSKFGNVFQFNSSAGKSISNFQIDRYITGVDFVIDVEEKTGYRIDIKYDSFIQKVKIGFVPVTDYSDSIEISEDYNIKYSFTHNAAGYNHIIGAGKGDLKDRAIVHYYADANGNISGTKTFTGLDERTYFYDYSSAESTSELRTATKKKLKELISGDKLEFDPKEFDLVVYPGDIIGGSKNGIKTSAPVESSVVKLSGGELTVEHKLKQKGKDET